MLRPLTVDDAADLARLRRESAAFLAPWEPAGRDGLMTVDGQLVAIADKVAAREAGRAAPFVIVEGDTVVGQLTLDNIVRGAFQNVYVGYWLAASATGRGLASAAVDQAVRHAFDDLGLHRVQADTLEQNTASQAVLTRCGFTAIGHAPQYLRIAGRWQDARLFQRINPQWQE